MALRGTAIRIENPELKEILEILVPELGAIDFDIVKGQWLIIDYPEPEDWTLTTDMGIQNNFVLTEGISIPTYKVLKK